MNAAEPSGCVPPSATMQSFFLFVFVEHANRSHRRPTFAEFYFFHSASFIDSLPINKMATFDVTSRKDVETSEGRAKDPWLLVSMSASQLINHLYLPISLMQSEQRLICLRRKMPRIVNRDHDSTQKDTLFRLYRAPAGAQQNQGEKHPSRSALCQHRQPRPYSQSLKTQQQQKKCQ